MIEKEMLKIMICVAMIEPCECGGEMKLDEVTVGPHMVGAITMYLCRQCGNYQRGKTDVAPSMALSTGGGLT